MRRFIISVTLFVLSLITPFLVFEGVIASINFHTGLEASYEEEIKSYAWISQSLNIKDKKLSIICGSSTLKYGLDCDELNRLSKENFYVSTAQDAGDPIRSYFILKSLQKDLVSKVYMGLDPWICTKYYYRHRKDIMYMDFSILEVFSFQNKHDQSAFLKRYRGLLQYLKPFNSDNAKTEVPERLGSGVREPKSTEVKNPCESYDEDFHWSRVQFLYLEKIVELCSENDWELVFIKPPKHPKYIDYIREDCTEIQDEWNRKTAYLSSVSNVIDMEQVIEDSDHFNDGVHLNALGQKAYSSIFKGFITKK